MIVREGQGFRIERDAEGDTLVVTDRWSTQAEALLDQGAADGLDLNYAKGFKDTDLAFLRPWPLRRLKLLARTVKDIGPIDVLSPTLESLSVESAPGATIDLTRFPMLTRLAAVWPHVAATIGERPELTDVYLGSYTEADLRPLRWNTGLLSLRLKDRPRLRSLDGIEAFPSMGHLGVYLAPLQDISALGSLGHGRLRELHLESCRMPSLAPVAQLRGLRVLDASDCGPIESLQPLTGLADLEVLWLYGTTRVSDDDLSPLLGLPRLRELRMRSRPSYRPSVEDVQALTAFRPPPPMPIPPGGWRPTRR